MPKGLQLGDIDAKPGTHAFVKLRVARRLIGSDFFIPVHLVAGAKDGPSVGVMIAVHGDEVFPIAALRKVVEQLNPNEMSGNLILIPIANPIGFAAGSRQTPDQWDKTNLWHNFPGKADGTTTEMMGHVISSKVFPLMDSLLEFHSGGIARLQNRVEYDGRAPEPLKKTIFEMAVSFGSGLIHESPVPPGGPTGYFNAKGKPAFQIEVGGPYLSGPDDDFLTEVIVRGVTNVLKHQKVIVGNPILPERQFWFERAGVRFETNPKEGGYLLSRRRNAADIGQIIEQDELLGEIFDPYSFELLEELRSPVHGILFFNKMSGPIEAGNKGYALAKLDKGRWVKGYSFE